MDLHLITHRHPHLVWEIFLHQALQRINPAGLIQRADFLAPQHSQLDQLISEVAVSHHPDHPPLLMLQQMFHKVVFRPNLPKDFLPHKVTHLILRPDNNPKPQLENIYRQDVDKKTLIIF